MGHIFLAHRSYSFEEVMSGQWHESDPYYAACLSFCQEWLNGKDFFFQLTSGSTGKPKSIQLGRSQMIASAQATSDFFNIKKSPRLLVCINTAMIGGKMMLVRGMLWDADIYITLPNARPFEANWLQLDFDFVAMVPMQVAASLNNARDLKWLCQIDKLIIGGASSSPELISQIQDHNIHAYQTYGMTETVSHIAVADLSKDDLIYHALPSVKIGVNASQCLWIEAPMALERHLQTNDIVTLETASSFRWLGRADFVINTGGVKVHPEILEAQIDKLVKEIYGPIKYFVAGETDEKLGQRIVLIIEHASDEKKEYILRMQLKENLEKYHVPKQIYAIEAFAYTDSTKINRQKTLSLCGFNQF
ncbi:AMP-binding protein [Belliella sp. DSM 111904]|uniref:AMP-binding protein n=1 Tax=Belliella filtrata TaxID=2923435 RepID=A0ABS9V3D9_9BACT|nr:AMP-binding protein [Belliella filtrata]MCH7410515.1 AMP-binding protein [Belliella filtrata]